MKSIGRAAVGIMSCLVLPLLAWGWTARGQAQTAVKSAEPAAPAKAAAVDVAGKDYSAELPRIPAVEPADALATFQVQPGFRLEQVAAEPLVNSPVAMAFDENGRLFVVEMRDYSEQDKDFLGVIRLLEDTNGDGRFDKDTIFADKLSWPTAITCFDGGVFVGAAPHIYYLKDTDGDNRADRRDLVFTGFNRTNVQGLLNSFHWGLDNRIHGSASTTGGKIVPGNNPQATPIVLSGRDFSFDPRILDLRPVSGGAQHGMSFDDWGRKFVCSNSDHIQLVMFEDRYVARNPYFAPPPARLSIAADGPQAEVYRISPVEPWRIVRTRLRVSGAVRGIVEGGGRAAGYFTGATGTTIYRGNAFPEEYRGQAFIGDVGSNIVHRKVLEPNGVALTARRVDEQREFVASKDTWFRPAQFANAPDGTLYILDVYREVIEHPHSIPPEIKKHLDLTSGRNRGRIYRLVPEKFTQPALPRLGTASTADLVALLEHRNGWHRDTASRLLFERQDRKAIPLLQELAKSARIPEGRMHALYVLSGLQALAADDVLARLSDDHPRVRAHAVRLAEPFLKKSPELRAKLLKMVNDDDLLVRYQLAFTLGEVPGADGSRALAALAVRDGSDRWMRTALFSSLGQQPAMVLAELARQAEFRRTAAGREFLGLLALQIGQQARKPDVAETLQTVESLSTTEAALAGDVIRGLSEGLARSGSPLRSELFASGGKAGKVLADLLSAARETAASEKAPAAERVQAVQTLGIGAWDEVRGVLAGLLSNRHPQDVQLAAIAALGRFVEPGVADTLLEAWPGFSPRVRSAAADVIFSRPAWLLLLLKNVQDDTIPLADLEPARVRLLESHAHPEVRQQGAALAKRFNLGRRQDVLAAYSGVLGMSGDAAKGKVVFQKICANCHRLENVGYEIGPNLATLQNRGAEAILLNVLDPNREVNPQYLNYIVVTNAGKSVNGMIAAESATSIQLKRAENATDTVLRIDIDEMRSSGVSIMPEGMEKQIDPAAMADLIAYLLSIK